MDKNLQYLKMKKYPDTPLVMDYCEAISEDITWFSWEKEIDLDTAMGIYVGRPIDGDDAIEVSFTILKTADEAEDEIGLTFVRHFYGDDLLEELLKRADKVAKAADNSVVEGIFAAIEMDLCPEVLNVG